MWEMGWFRWSAGGVPVVDGVAVDGHVPVGPADPVPAAIGRRGDPHGGHRLCRGGGGGGLVDQTDRPTVLGGVGQDQEAVPVLRLLGGGRRAHRGRVGRRERVRHDEGAIQVAGTVGGELLDVGVDLVLGLGRREQRAHLTGVDGVEGRPAGAGDGDRTSRSHILNGPGGPVEGARRCTVGADGEAPHVGAGTGGGDHAGDGADRGGCLMSGGGRAHRDTEHADGQRAAGQETQEPAAPPTGPGGRVPPPHFGFPRMHPYHPSCAHRQLALPCYP